MGEYSALWVLVVLKHQAMSIHSADKISIIFDHFHKKKCIYCEEPKKIILYFEK